MPIVFNEIIIIESSSISSLTVESILLLFSAIQNRDIKKKKLQWILIVLVM